MPIQYLRAITYFTPEGIIGTPKRFSWNRRNPYLRNRGLDDLAKGGPIKSSDCDNLDNSGGMPPPQEPPPCVKQEGMAPEFGLSAYPHLERDQP